MMRNTRFLLGGLFSVALLAGCPATDTTDTSNTDNTDNTDDPAPPDTVDTFDDEPDTVGGYAINFVQLGVDAKGGVSSFSFVNNSGETVTADPAIFVVWYNQDEVDVCFSEWSVVSSSITGGPFDMIARTDGTTPEASTQTYNAWDWSLTYVEDDCEGVLGKKDLAFIQAFLPETMYVALSPVAGALGNFATDSNGLGIAPEFAGMLGLWDSGDKKPGPSNPLKGGEFYDQRIFVPFEWDGKLIDGKLQPKDISGISPGQQTLTGAVLTDEGGWRFTFQ